LILNVAIVASYVKFVESAGGRAAVIPYDASREHLKKLFDSVNGLLFTGGGLDLVSDSTIFRNHEIFMGFNGGSQRKRRLLPILGY
jgi:gamma-glutamyl hydrolase